MMNRSKNYGTSFNSYYESLLNSWSCGKCSRTVKNVKNIWKEIYTKIAQKPWSGFFKSYEFNKTSDESCSEASSSDHDEDVKTDNKESSTKSCHGPEEEIKNKDTVLKNNESKISAQIKTKKSKGNKFHNIPITVSTAISAPRINKIIISRGTNVNVRTRDALIGDEAIYDDTEIKSKLEELESFFSKHNTESLEIKESDTHIPHSYNGLINCNDTKIERYVSNNDTNNSNKNSGDFEEPHADSEMVISLNSSRDEKHEFIYLLQVMHKTNTPLEYSTDLQEQKQNPVDLLYKVQEIFGKIVNNEITLVKSNKAKLNKPNSNKLITCATYETVNSNQVLPQFDVGPEIYSRQSVVSSENE